MQARGWVGWLALLLTAAPFLGSLPPEPPAVTGPRAGVEDLHWLTGCWERQEDGQELREIWSPPCGDALSGMLHWARRGHVWLYELMSIEEENDTLVFRLRHFDRKLKVWDSEADGPMTYPLKELGEQEAVFENPEADSPRIFRYRRSGDHLTISLEGPDRDGQQFQFSLADM